MAIDLKNPAAGGVLDDLLRAADVMVENFLPDTLAQFGLTPERLASLNPRLVELLDFWFRTDWPAGQCARL